MDEEEEDLDPRSPPSVISMDHVLPAGEPAEQPAGMTHSPSTYVVQFQTRNPIWRLSPWHNGSTLYDSYELKAVTHQLNKAIQQASTAASSSPYVSHLKSPFCRQRLDSIYKQATKTQRRISGGQAPHDRNPSAGRARGFVTRLWKKLKQGLFRSKQKNESGSKASIE
ncbi:hypothetical protein AAG906_001158 [Vitis piasezkii]